MSFLTRHQGELARLAEPIREFAGKHMLGARIRVELVDLATGQLVSDTVYFQPAVAEWQGLKKLRERRAD
jgi:hypothetical protein